MPLSSVWTLNGALASELGVEGITLSLQSLREDKATISMQVPDALADPAFAFGATVSIANDGAQVFAGTLQSAPEVRMTGTGERLNFELLGPWWYLENIIFQQSWTARNPLKGTAGQPDTITEHRSKLVFGQSVEGAPMTTGESIAEVLAWAIAAGAPLQVGTLLAGVTPPAREQLDITCAEAIRIALRWTPDAVAWFDYSTTPPTLHIQRRADLTAVTLPTASEIATSLAIKARRDLQVSSVTLKFLQTGDFDGETWSNTVLDRWPVGASEQAPKALVQTIELSGGSTTTQKQAVVTRSIPALDASDADIISWWKTRSLEKVPKGIAGNKLEVVESSYYGEVNAGQLKADGATPQTLDWGDLGDRELVMGSVTAWMEQANTTLGAAQATMGVGLRYKLPLVGTTEEQAKIKALFNLESSDPSTKNVFWINATPVVTNAVSQTYSQVVSSTEGETVPTGLAQSFYGALATLHYEGSFETTDAEISLAVGMGCVLNLSGGREEWAAMNALVQQISHDVAQGKTTVTFGPPEHLTPQDMVEFIRGQRNSVPSYRTEERKTGKATPTGGTVAGIGYTPNTGTTGSGGAASVAELHPFKVLDASTADMAKVKVYEFSDLWKDFGQKFGAGSLPAITNLGTEFAIAEGKCLYLSVGVTSQDDVTPDAASIEYGDFWAEHPDPLVWTTDGGGTYQTDYNQIIAEVVSIFDPREGMTVGPAGAQLKIIQHLKTSRLCVLRVRLGKAVMVLIEAAL